MAFTKKTWKDRISQYLNRRRLVDVNTNEVQTVSVIREEGTITEAGDAFSAANMNDLESRIETAFDAITAADVSYDNTNSSMTADDVQEAIDEIATSLATQRGYVFNMGAVSGSGYTITTNSYNLINNSANAYLSAGTWIYMFSVNATWTNDSYQFGGGLKYGSNYQESNSSYAGAQTNSPCIFFGKITISTSNTYSLQVWLKTASSTKPITIPPYQAVSLVLIKTT